MAVEKKASTAKAVSKKVTAKKAAAGKKLISTSLLIKIPKGGQIIRSFNLTPSRPLDGKAANWILVDPAQPTKDIDSMRFSFNSDSSDLEQEFERAIVEINIVQNPDETGIWRFASHGVTVNPAFSDVNHDVVVEISNQGFTLIAQVQLIGDVPEDIRFGYLASFTDSMSGEVTTYESSDPDIKVGRP
jgi:hypothetical protein